MLNVSMCLCCRSAKPLSDGDVCIGCCEKHVKRARELVGADSLNPDAWCSAYKAIGEVARSATSSALPYEETGPLTVCPCCLEVGSIAHRMNSLACDACYYAHLGDAAANKSSSNNRQGAWRAAFYAVGQKLRLAAAREVDEPSRGGVWDPVAVSLRWMQDHALGVALNDARKGELFNVELDETGEVTALARAIFETDPAVVAYVEKGAEGRDDVAWRAGLIDRMWIDDRGGWRTASEARAEQIEWVRWR